MTNSQMQPQNAKIPATKTAFVVMDTESIPDGRLLNLVKYPGLGLSDEEAIERARAEARASSPTGSDFIPYTFQLPVAVCAVRVDIRFALQSIRCIDAPLYRTREIATKFWNGLLNYTNGAALVTFNGRGFDLPMLELAAFRYGCPAKDYFTTRRKRFSADIDLQDFMMNYGATRGLAGGLNLLAKLIGKPGKMGVSGDQVYEMYKQGKLQEINDYCMFDTLDTYFVFLRTRVLTGDISPEREAEIIVNAREVIAKESQEHPALRNYLDAWTDGQPWP